MNSAKQLTEAERKKAVSDENSIDPFAGDFFGVKSVPEIASPIEAHSEKPDKLREKLDWHRSLPQITNQEAGFSYALENLPENLTEKSAEVISRLFARYTFREPEKVSCSIISVSEVELNEAAARISKSPQIFFTLGCQPENASAVISINSEFASAVIDLILGGRGEEFAASRSLSPIENAITEFLAVSILGEINDYLGEPLLCLQNISEEAEHSFENGERGGEFVFIIEMEKSSGILTAFAPRDFLNNLDKSQNPLLARSSAKKKLDDFERIAEKLDLRLRVGTTFLDADTVLFLEPDDIILIEQPEISPEKGLLSDNLQICVGNGKNFRLSGTAENREADGELTFEIKEIVSEKSRGKFTPIKLMINEQESVSAEENNIETEDTKIEAEEPEEAAKGEQEEAEEASDEQIAASLENVQLALRVEIAGSKISLRELQNMRPGQIIALGCRPTDPVRIITDNNEEPIAKGELIDIEGQLGVRLTKVFI